MARRRSGPPKVHFTRAGVVKPIVDYFDEIGCPTWKFLSKVHLAPALLDDPVTPVPVRLFHDFVHRASCAEGVDNPGLRAAESVPLDALGAFGDLLLRSRNVFRYLQEGCRLIPSVTTNESFWMEFEEGQVRFCHSEADIDRPLEAYLFVLGITINTIRAVVGEHWIPSEVLLPVEPPPRLADISRSFTHARADARRRYASFTFPVSFLTLPMRRPGRQAPPAGEFDFVTAHPIDFGESVRRLAETLVHDGHADLPTAAEASGMSARTFQRRLAECGAGFSTLVLEARITLSEQWLRETDRPITDIAHSLGYADSANFTRAFRRVNGLSPQAYRGSLETMTPGIEHVAFR